MFLLFLEHKYETFPCIITCLPFICTNLPLEELLWHWNWGGTKIIQPASQKIELKSWPKCLEMLPHPYGPFKRYPDRGALVWPPFLWYGLWIWSGHPITPPTPPPSPSPLLSFSEFRWISTSRKLLKRLQQSFHHTPDYTESERLTGTKQTRRIATRICLMVTI